MDSERVQESSEYNNIYDNQFTTNCHVCVSALKIYERTNIVTNLERKTS